MKDDLISKLSEIRSQYNCFDEAEEPYYRALSEVIKKLSEYADGDTISRQAAIDAAIDAADDWDGGYSPSRADMIEKAIDNLLPARPEITLESAIDYLYSIGWMQNHDKQMYEDGQNHAQPEPQWIPCSERPPNHDEYIKNNGLFIVSDGNRSYSEWYDIYGKRRFGEPTMSGFRIDYAVDAWMSLPEPYAERREE